MRLVRPDGAEIEVGSLLDQVYSMQDCDGWQYHWSVTEATRRALSHGSYWTVSLSEVGITCDFIRGQYQDLDEAYAMTTNLACPVLFVPFKGTHQLIDGWHRLFKAAATGVDILPALVLSQEDADASLIIALPPGKGLDWGQSSGGPAAAADPTGSEAGSTEFPQAETEATSLQSGITSR